MSIFEHQDFDNHETVVFARDQASGLRAIIALHSTRLGPATGGCRLWTYDSEAGGIMNTAAEIEGVAAKSWIEEKLAGRGEAIKASACGSLKSVDVMRRPPL